MVGGATVAVAPYPNCSAPRAVRSSSWGSLAAAFAGRIAWWAVRIDLRSKQYGDVLAGGPRRRPPVPEVPAEPGLVVEEPGAGRCGAGVGLAKDAVTLEDRHGKRRVFPLRPGGFLLDGRPVTLVRPQAPPDPGARRRTASGSLAVPDTPARVARASRIYVEGVHDA